VAFDNIYRGRIAPVIGQMGVAFVECAAGLITGLSSPSTSCHFRKFGSLLAGVLRASAYSINPAEIRAVGAVRGNERSTTA